MEEKEPQNSAATTPEKDEAIKEEIKARIDLLRLATREEIISAMEFAREGSTGAFFLNLFAPTKILSVEEIERSLAERNRQARESGGKEWSTKIGTIPHNLNNMLGTKTGNTGLKIEADENRWRWESQRVQKPEEISGRKREEYTQKLDARHQRTLELSQSTEEISIKCLLKILANQKAGVRLEETEEIFAETKINVPELIERTNAEILASHDIKIHIRNGIVILGPQNPHWDSELGEPILIDRKAAESHLSKWIQEGIANQIKNELNPPHQVEIDALKENLAEAERKLALATKQAEEAERLREEMEALKKEVERLKGIEQTLREEIQTYEELLESSTSPDQSAAQPTKVTDNQPLPQPPAIPQKQPQAQPPSKPQQPPRAQSQPKPQQPPQPKKGSRLDDEWSIVSLSKKEFRTPDELREAVLGVITIACAKTGVLERKELRDIRDALTNLQKLQSHIHELRTKIVKKIKETIREIEGAIPPEAVNRLMTAIRSI